MAVFEASVELACTPEMAFDFLIQPKNIRLITPSAMMLVFDAAPQRLSLGARMEFRVQTHGVVRSAKHDVTEFDPPHKFVELQIEGPLGAWEHEHLFKPTPAGVLVTDRITFAPPSGMLGLLVNERKIRESLEEGFGHRHHELEKRFGSSGGSALMAERPSDDQRNSATFAALTMVLLISGGLVALVALVLPQVLWMVVIAIGLALSVVLQYLVWGRWLTSKLRREAEDEEPQTKKPD